MHVRPDTLLQNAQEVLNILYVAQAVHKIPIDNPVDAALADATESHRVRVAYRRRWDCDTDDDYIAHAERLMNGRLQLVEWLNFTPKLTDALMERLVAIGVVGGLTWWNSLLGEVLDQCHGIKQIGSGAYGSVFGIEGSNEVLKIIMCSSGDSWHAYARKVMDTEGNPYLPRIHGIWFWNDVMVARMEKLETNPLFKEDGGEMFRTVCYDDPPETKEIIEKMYLGSTSSNPNASKWLAEVRQIFKEVIDETDGCRDIHNGNLMFRDGVPVLTDPISSGRCPYSSGMECYHRSLKEKLYAQ